MMLMRPDFCVLVFLLIVASVCVSANTTSSPDGKILAPRSRGGVPVPKEESGTLRIEVIDPPEEDVPNPPRVDSAGGDRAAETVHVQEQQLVRTGQEHQLQEESTEGAMKTDKAKPDAPEKLTPTVDAQPTPTQLTDPKSNVPQGEINPALPQDIKKPKESQDPKERDIPSDSNSLSNTNTVSKETGDSGASSTTPSPQTSADTTASDGTPVNSSQEGIKNADANGTESPDTTTNTSESINTDTPNTTSNNEELTSTPSPVPNAEINTIASTVQTNKPIVDSSVSPVWMGTAAPLLIVVVMFSATVY
ncbi:uncharacterized protein TM35_000511380 [Trypanosoma theileri]|uniref:Mucin TcMUCII n=1 Tax=Trypanosoma theileri TaxID=67003 RepID=A0A1X0NHB5_9TRYP|nr:uncharacterized protein TM35_000511380 [Trypanosoma theileri]ORC84037.1 hypothetical protein TM35_000511380 [Trypanosoma theileri]